MKRLKWKLDSVCLEIVLILMQDRYTVCMEHTKCLEINLDAHNELLDDVCHTKSCFGLFGDSVSFSAR
jgi:hypothetical protein